MIRKDELSFVGGPAEWIIAKQREDARRVATAQRRNGYKTGYPPACAFLTPHAYREPRAGANPHSDPHSVRSHRPSLQPSLRPALQPVTRWYPHVAAPAATAATTAAMLRAPAADAVPLSAEGVEWVLSEQPGQRMSVSALNDVFRTQTKAERERLAGLVAEVRTVVARTLTFTRTLARTRSPTLTLTLALPLTLSPTLTSCARSCACRASGAAGVVCGP